ncbi:MAG: PRC-barrel domain-containing protein [Hyphomicrobiaceae bacterium]|nr:PRC-barrel domain-containing protein [Hyphomicrobiaceae bacterium]
MKLLIPRIAGVIAVLGGAALVGMPLATAPRALAQQTLPTPSPAPPPTSPPKTEPGAGPATEPSKGTAVPPSEAPAAPQRLVGLNVFSADGTRVGEVRSVATGPGGEIVALHIRTGGFLGFGGRIVAIPEGKFIRSGQSIRLDLDADDVSGLPEVKD